MILIIVQVPCHTPFAARAQCASYKDLRDVPGRASLHYEFKHYGQYGLLDFNENFESTLHC
jgi:hypothetical protein